VPAKKGRAPNLPMTKMDRITGLSWKTHILEKRGGKEAGRITKERKRMVANLWRIKFDKTSMKGEERI
jgi:hypothetical protein